MASSTSAPPHPPTYGYVGLTWPRKDAGVLAGLTLIGVAPSSCWRTPRALRVVRRSRSARRACPRIARDWTVAECAPRRSLWQPWGLGEQVIAYAPKIRFQC